MLAPVTEADFGADELIALNLASWRIWPEFARELETAAEREVAPSAEGALVVALDRDDAEELERLHRLQLELGLDASWLGPSACRELEPGLAPRLAGAIHAPGDAAVEPRALLAALAVALDRAGGDLVIGLEAELEHDGVAVTGVATAAGSFRAPAVVLASGAWTTAMTGVPEGLLPAVRPVKGQILRLRGAPPARMVVRTPRCYVVSRPSGEVVVGATMEDQGFDTAVTAGAARELLEAAWEVLPDTAELELAETTAGLRPAAPDNLPLIGPTGLDGLVAATGHFRNGILLAPITAAAVAAHLAGEPELAEVAPFTPERHPGRIEVGS
jgi:glycine oxidase